MYSTCHWGWNFFLKILLLNFFQISYSDYSMKWKYWFWYHNGIGIKWRAKSNPIKWKGNLVSFEQILFFCFLNWVSLYLSSTRFYKTNMWQIVLFGNRHVIYVLLSLFIEITFFFFTNKINLLNLKYISERLLIMVKDLWQLPNVSPTEFRVRYLALFSQ